MRCSKKKTKKGREERKEKEGNNKEAGREGRREEGKERSLIPKLLRIE